MATSKAKSTAKKKASTKSVAAKKPAAAAVKTETASASSSSASTKKAAMMIRPSALIAEFVGTFLLAGAVIAFAGDKLNVMFTLIILVVVFGVISGAHLNPAITVAQWVNKKVGWMQAVLYIVAQVLGAILAYLVLKALFDANLEASVTNALASQGYTAEVLKQQYGGFQQFVDGNGGLATIAAQLKITFFQVPTLAAGKEWIALWAELLGSTIFGMGVGYAVLAKAKSTLTTGFAVGGSLFIALAIAGSTAILNPAVAAAVGAFAGGWHISLLWVIAIYVLTTCIGMTLGFTIYRFVLKDATEKIKA